MSIKKIRDINRVPAFLKELKEFKDHEVNIGIFGEGGDNILLIATVHEYGTNITVTPKMRAYMAYQGMPLKASTTEIKIPERSFMRSAWEAGLQNKIDSYTRQAMKDIIHKKVKARDALTKIGDLAVKEVKNFMYALRQPPLVDGGNPLVDTGKMMNSVTYKIKKR